MVTFVSCLPSNVANNFINRKRRDIPLVNREQKVTSFQAIFSVGLEGKGA